MNEAKQETVRDWLVKASHEPTALPASADPSIGHLISLKLTVGSG
jgi:hypothetical protein